MSIIQWGPEPQIIIEPMPRARTKVKLLLVDAALQGKKIFQAIRGTDTCVYIDPCDAYSIETMVWRYATPLEWLRSLGHPVRQLKAVPVYEDLTLNEALEIIETTRYMAKR
jgi:hypothetical protein